MPAHRSICSRCSSELRSPPLLRGLMEAACQPVAPQPAAGQPAAAVPLPHDDRAAVVEGLARVVAALPEGSAPEAGQMLVQPLLQRAQAIISHGAPPAVARLPCDTAAGRRRLFATTTTRTRMRQPQWSHVLCSTPGAQPLAPGSMRPP
jgi:hypothetical protein